MKNKNLVGQLMIMKDLRIKPNYSALAREYGTDRHTVKKYYENNGIPARKKRMSRRKWDVYREEMDNLLKNPHVNYRALYLYLLHKYGEGTLPGTYNSLRNYYYAEGRRCKSHNKPHVLYETPPGRQAQFDWKENMCIHLKDGTEVTFNVFSLTLSYSREHVFVYSPGKGLDDFLHSFIKAINRVGGVCDEYLTDNMSSIVSVKGNRRRINSKVTSLFKDIEAKLILSKVKTPQTKGKDENANKFVSWIYPYHCWRWWHTCSERKRHIRDSYQLQYAGYLSDEKEHKDIIIDSNTLGIEETAKILAQAAKSKFDLD